VIFRQGKNAAFEWTEFDVHAAAASVVGKPGEHAVAEVLNLKKVLHRQLKTKR
jgi:hypothetical protein